MTRPPAPRQPVYDQRVYAPPRPRPPVARPVPTFMTVAEIAAQLRVSKMTVYRLLHAGEIRSVRVGHGFRIPEQAVTDYLQRPDDEP